jgi:Tfp pilus assembly protein PilV
MTSAPRPLAPRRARCRHLVGSPRRGAAGFSLVEILVSISFTSVVLLGFAANTIYVARAGKVSNNVATATTLAQQQLEHLRSLPLGAPALASGTYTDDDNPLAADGAPGGIFQRTWTVSADDVPEAGLKTVTVMVAWTDYGPHQTRIASYVRCSTVPCP